MSEISDFGDIIILHPDFIKLKAEVKKLRTELSMLVLERDDLLYHECKNIETTYMLSLGAKEYKAYELECAVLRLKRKMELIQAKKNRQEKILIDEIEVVLDSEFFEYQEKLDEQIEKMNEALERNRLDTLTEEEERELKKLYRSIVKILHPDMVSNLTEAEVQLFYNAVAAYENGDIEGLRIIAAMALDPVLPQKESEGLEFLKKEKERLIILLNKTKERISGIKLEMPYILKAILNNPDLLEKRKLELEEIISKLTEVLAIYKAKIDELLR